MENTTFFFVQYLLFIKPIFLVIRISPDNNLYMEPARFINGTTCTHCPCRVGAFHKPLSCDKGRTVIKETFRDKTTFELLTHQPIDLLVNICQTILPARCDNIYLFILFIMACVDFGVYYSLLCLGSGTQRCWSWIGSLWPRADHSGAY